MDKEFTDLLRLVIREELENDRAKANKTTKEDILKIKDTQKRQEEIKKNMELFK